MVKCVRNNFRLKFYIDIVAANNIAALFKSHETGHTVSPSLRIALDCIAPAKSKVMKTYSTVIFLLLSLALSGQPLRDINYVYLYSQNEPFTFKLKPVRSESGFTILYSFQAGDTAAIENEYSVQWEARAQLSDKEGVPLSFVSNGMNRHAAGFKGIATLALAGAPRYVVAKVTKNSAKRAWLFYTVLESTQPVNNYFIRQGEVVLTPFIHTKEPVKPGDDRGPWIVSYYNDEFPAAAPPFSEVQARVSKGMKSDSTYHLPSESEVTFAMKGLYLIQKDTNALEGFAFRAEEDYPQYTKLSNLAGPLIYICTKQEYDRLELAKGNKKAFDRVILNMAADPERAKRLMRGYFRRVELANQYFTSYKEGWKTDRGMIYIIFGVPDEVYKFSDREVWHYDNEQIKKTFNFSKSTTLFDPDNYVLIRENKYKDDWYEVIDLWRSARF
jgi:GWxTD domain-containing protein